jgi:hypothetical protein
MQRDQGAGSERGTRGQTTQSPTGGAQFETELTGPNAAEEQVPACARPRLRNEKRKTGTLRYKTYSGTAIVYRVMLARIRNRYRYQQRAANNPRRQSEHR